MSAEFECPFCEASHRSPNGTGSDIACCGEVGHCRIVCPICGCDDIDQCHKDANAAIPETYYKVCAECGHQFDIE